MHAGWRDCGWGGAQLLSHRGGLEHDSRDGQLFEALYTDRRSLPEQRMAYVERALQEPPAVRPGSRPYYSNSGFIIAAAIAERATGSSYEDLVRRHVFDPLGMKSVQFGVTHGDQPLGHRDGRPVLALPDGRPQFAPPDGQQGNPLFYAPAGNRGHAGPVLVHTG
jgi:CubicO group peptidase (beta-lactamase class C family)